MEKLHILAVISNPANFKSRFDLYDKFKQYIEKEKNAILYTAELIYQGQEYKITEECNPHHLQLNGKDEIWSKENMINLLEKKLPRDWKYVAWIDADVMFSRVDWVEETIRQLEHNDVVQLFSECRDLDPNYCTIPNAVQKGIVHQFYHNPKFLLSDGIYGKRTGHTGYAWACTREAWDKMQGLIDFSIMGSADYQMACAWLGDAMASTYGGAYSEDYCNEISHWGSRVSGFKIGYVEGLCLHNYHGKKQDRGYNWRWKVLVDGNYSPKEHLYKDHKGIVTFNKLHKDYEYFRTALINYFRSRNEDEHLSGE